MMSETYIEVFQFAEQEFVSVISMFFCYYYHYFYEIRERVTNIILTATRRAQVIGVLW